MEVVSRETIYRNRNAVQTNPATSHIPRRSGDLSRMIDNAAQMERLLARLNAALPVPAIMTPELLTTLRKQNPAGKLSPACAITWISYAGDEGGITCKLDLGSETENATFVSITHLRFDPRQPLTREITAYQKHRVKRLRRQLPN
jgi:hypothetical protein